MRVSHLSLYGLFAAAIQAGCAANAPTRPALPAALRAPADQALYLEAHASGVQIYECTRKADSTFDWVFKSPEASLASRSGQPLGKHYGGPTWEANDGSIVVGEVKAKDPGPNASAIPWLLLAAKSNNGSGTFAAAKSIQRIATEGGLAPAQACTAAELMQVVRIPYSAIYYFYR